MASANVVLILRNRQLKNGRNILTSCTDTNGNSIIGGGGGKIFASLMTSKATQKQLIGLITDAHNSLEQHTQTDGTTSFHSNVLTIRLCWFSITNALSDVYLLAAKELDDLGRGYIELDLRFPERPVENLHLVVFDLDEGDGPRQEQLLVNAYNGIESSRANKIDPRKWDIVAQGDLSLDVSPNPNSTAEAALPPLWFTVNDGTQDSFGLLQARKKSIQNRDYTVLTMPDAVTRLRLLFRASRGEVNNEIGSHVYIGLWHDSQPCRRV